MIDFPSSPTLGQLFVGGGKTWEYDGVRWIPEEATAGGTAFSDSATPVSEFGAVGDGVTDDTLALQAAVASGQALTFNSGTYIITDTITCNNEQHWSTEGKVTIKANFPIGGAARSMVDFKQRVVGTGHFIFDQQSHTRSYVTPTAYNNDILGGASVIVQGNKSFIDGWEFINAWDTGLAAVKFSGAAPGGYNYVDGSPQEGTFTNIRSSNCGVGEHTFPVGQEGKLGCGINIATASGWTVSDCIDRGSYGSFILDTGAGAQCQFVNCVAWLSLVDPANPNNSSGFGFYVGGYDSSFVNCHAAQTRGNGWVIDGGYNSFASCSAYFTRRNAIYMKGFGNSVNMHIRGASYLSDNVYDAVTLDCSAFQMTATVLDLVILGTTHKYALAATGGLGINASITGNIQTGMTGLFNNTDSYNITYTLPDPTNASKTMFNRTNALFEFDYKGRQRITGKTANASYSTSAFGDVPNDNGTVMIQDATTPQKRKSEGYDPVNDCYVQQSIHAGVMYKPMLLNPSGGAVGVGRATWDHPVIWGSYRMWITASGALFIKNGVPVSDSDGTAVGGSAVASEFPAGTNMLFVQTNAPTGWTKRTDHANKALRITATTAGSGGVYPFIDTFSAGRIITGSVTTTIGSTTATGSVSVSGTVGGTALTEAQLPAHSHALNFNGSANQYTTGTGGADVGQGTNNSGFSTRTTGSGATHDHSWSGSGTFSGVSHGHTATSVLTLSNPDFNVAYVDAIIATKD